MTVLYSDNTSLLHLGVQAGWCHRTQPKNPTFRIKTWPLHIILKVFSVYEI